MLYQNIVDYFIDNIERGSILPGEKLPSLRNISDQFDVSLSTAVEAYRKLELFGYVQVKDRSGYSARFPSRGDNVLQPSKKFKPKVCEIDHIDEIIELINQTMDKETAPFGVGTPALERYPNKMLNRYTIQTIKHNPESSGAYIFGMGLEELRSELGRWIRPWVGVTPSNNIMITNGCLEAINIALGAECDSGDLVAIESPCYFGLLHAIHHHGLKAIEVKTDPTLGIDPESLESLAKTKKIKALISTPNAQNPLGFCMSDERKKQIIAICKKYNIRLIEDDLYGEICFNKKRPKTYKYFDKDGIVTHCSSFSKFLGPGLRIGWVIPAQNSQKYVRQKLSLNLATNSLTQHVVANILRNENLLTFGQNLGEYYQQNVQIYANVLQSQLGSKITLSKPTGSYFLWARVEGLDAISAYQKAKKQKISFTPGPLFSANRQYNNYLRINCAHEYNERRHQELIALSKILNNS
jgi:DNA-binding transcriptional MocR family regulator